MFSSRANSSQIRSEILRRLSEREKEFKQDFIKTDDTVFRNKIESMFKHVLREARIQLDPAEQNELFEDVLSHFFGLGPLDKLLKDPDISEIMVNGPNQVFIERHGRIELCDLRFTDEDQLSHYIERILSPMGRRVTEFEPCVDARLKDGSRINVVRSPVSGIGPVISIRKFVYRKLGAEDLISSGSVTDEAVAFLKACVEARLNILVSGGAGAGKTTLLNVLFSFIAQHERVITIEDTRELRCAHVHTVPMETRPPNIEGKGEITIRDLFRNALHMRPDRIIVGEVRSDEVIDMIQSMNTGHEGSMTTLHANSPLEALDRLEILALMGKSNISSDVIKRQIIGVIDIIVQLARLPDGSRKVVKVSSLLKDKEYSVQDIFCWNEDASRLEPSPTKPQICSRIERSSPYRWI
jgi:pilus assembly protein CpaF